MLLSNSTRLVGANISILNILFSLVYLIISLGLLFLLIKLLQYLVHTNLPNHIGYVPSNLKLVGPVIDSVISKHIGKHTEKYTFVEPGCGLATISEYVSRKYIWKSLLAVDDESSVLFLAKQRVRNKKIKIEFLKQNVLDLKLEKPAVIYSYLLSNIVTKMYKNGVFKNSLLISLSFSIDGIEPTETIPILGMQKVVYVYDFREINNE